MKILNIKQKKHRRQYGLKRKLMLIFLALCVLVFAFTFAFIQLYRSSAMPVFDSLFLVAALAGSVVLVYIVFWKIVYTPVSKIETIINTLFNKKDAEDSEESHVRITSRDLDTVIIRLQNLINSEYAAEIMKNQAELHALQSQINPHFLYNTLESIRGQAIAHKVKDIEVMTKALADMFRYVISKKSAFISFREELVNVDNYLKIQQFRFNNKFIIEKDIDEDTMDNQIPKLLIQPIVENALQHGLEMKRTNGKIGISAYCTGENFIVNIKDDGLGMNIEKLQELNQALADNIALKDKKSGGSIGLLNVNERIKITFGMDCGIKIYSAENVGTNVEIILKPVKKKPVIIGNQIE